MTRMFSACRIDSNRVFREKKNESRKSSLRKGSIINIYFFNLSSNALVSYELILTYFYQRFQQYYA